ASSTSTRAWAERTRVEASARAAAAHRPTARAGAASAPPLADPAAPAPAGAVHPPPGPAAAREAPGLRAFPLANPLPRPATLPPRDRTALSSMSKRLFVGNLPYQVDDAAILAAFQSQGFEAASARVVLDRETGRSRGFAFVDFDSDDA